MKLLLVDDETLALQRLTRLLNEAGMVDITTCNSAIAALVEAAKQQFDAIFLDISMPQMNGIELAEKINEISPSSFLIFQTAYDNYAVQAFECGGIDYIIKPIESSHIQRVLQRIQHYKQNALNKENKKLLGKRGNRLYLINIQDIYYIKADLDEVIVKIKEADVNVKKKISQLEEILEDNFFKVHRSCIINVDKIKALESVEQSKLQISFNGIDDVITSSKDGAKEFREYLEKKTV